MNACLWGSARISLGFDRSLLDELFAFVIILGLIANSGVPADCSDRRKKQEQSLVVGDRSEIKSWDTVVGDILPDFGNNQSDRFQEDTIELVPLEFAEDGRRFLDRPRAAIAKRSPALDKVN